MTLPPPHPDDRLAAALDDLRAVLDSDPMRVPDLILALQAVYAASFRLLQQQVDQGQLITGAQFELINAKLDRLVPPPSSSEPLASLENRLITAKELHEISNKMQQMMELTVLERENQSAIIKLHGLLTELKTRLDTVVQDNGLIERAVGDQEPPP